MPFSNFIHPCGRGRRAVFRAVLRAAAILGLTMLCAGPVQGQAKSQALDWLPLNTPPPILAAGARELVSKATVLYVSQNPSAYGEGMEGEVSFGVTLPLARYSSAGGSSVWALSATGGVFARFGLQITERELAATDWFFTIPVHWIAEQGWVRLRYYHTSSHRGDEYIRRFEDAGVHFARDGVELLGVRTLVPGVQVHGGGGFGVNVHPAGSGRWWFRAGGVLGPEAVRDQWKPTFSLDADFDAEAGYTPRWTVQGGVWLPAGEHRRRIRLMAELITGPSPLGQFLPARTTQIGAGFLLYL